MRNLLCVQFWTPSDTTYFWDKFPPRQANFFQLPIGVTINGLKHSCGSIYTRKTLSELSSLQELQSFIYIAYEFLPEGKFHRLAHTRSKLLGFNTKQLCTNYLSWIQIKQKNFELTLPISLDKIICIANAWFSILWKSKVTSLTINTKIFTKKTSEKEIRTHWYL